jgi:hypothetical protein
MIRDETPNLGTSFDSGSKTPSGVKSERFRRISCAMRRAINAEWVSSGTVDYLSGRVDSWVSGFLLFVSIPIHPSIKILIMRRVCHFFLTGSNAWRYGSPISAAMALHLEKKALPSTRRRNGF